MKLSFLTSALIVLVFDSPQECFTAVTTIKPQTQKTPTSEPGIIVDVFEKYHECQNKCKKDGEKLECGINGWWFLNKCHRECEGIKLSTMGDKECDPFEKEAFDKYWKCQVKCDGKQESRDCGEDGAWYENGCRRECYGIMQADKKLCEKLDKMAECENKCITNEVKPECGADGAFYDNACRRECLGVKAGVLGKDCKKRLNMAKYWYCQEDCSEKEEEKEECGKSGYYFYNKCHRECYGDQLGTPGKDCQNEVQ